MDENGDPRIGAADRLAYAFEGWWRTFPADSWDWLLLISVLVIVVG